MSLLARQSAQHLPAGFDIPATEGILARWAPSRAKAFMAHPSGPIARRLGHEVTAASSEVQDSRIARFSALESVASARTSVPEAISVYVSLKAPDAVRIGLETGPTTTQLETELRQLGLPAICGRIGCNKMAPIAGTKRTLTPCSV
jgi:hypothetical protein